MVRTSRKFISTWLLGQHHLHSNLQASAELCWIKYCINQIYRMDMTSLLWRVCGATLCLLCCSDRVGSRAPVISQITVTESGVEADTAEGIDPWTINQNVCPPILCGPVIPPGAGANPAAIAREPVAFSFFEGDIVLDTRQRSRMQRRQRSRQRRHRVKRSIIKPAKKLWKYGSIPFAIDQNFDDETRMIIHRAHRHIERATCLRFREKQRADDDYLFYMNQPGCWSYVGRTGGMQTISLGYGCEQLGTAVHETCHALGFWHEQSRLDRDRYVQILLDNVSPAGKSQFGKRDRSESTSRGFAYDYSSIMHYGDKYFSSNGRDTIRPKGIGETLSVKIGQRRGLSEIDIAQLNDMYYCNNKDQTGRVCGRGWEPYEGRCYKFVSDNNKTYAGARSGCARLGAGLVHVTSAGKDRFLKATLKELYRQHPVWRVGGRRIEGQLQWEDPYGSRHRPMTYEAWAPNHPGDFTTTVLRWASSTNKTYVWKGTWAGSPSKPDKFAYPYICERKDYKCDRGWVNWGKKCYKFDSDKKTFQRAHEKCVERSAQLLHINTKEEDEFIKDYLLQNFPKSTKWRAGARKARKTFHWYDKKLVAKQMTYLAWAPGQPADRRTLVLAKASTAPRRFVWKGARTGEKSDGGSAYRFSFICEKNAQINCFQSSTNNGRDYRGQVSYTERGVTCQKWTSQYPQVHDYMAGRQGADKREGLGDHNYCRNPYGRRVRPWCYVPLKDTKWQYCDIAVCR